MLSPLHPRHRLDASPAFALGALATLLRAPRPPDVDEPGAPLVCLSVRSGFELLLDTLDLPAGDEVLVSAITHPDMAHLLELHGLRPVPVDVDPWTLSPHPAALQAALTERTRMILVAHLFGARVDLDGVVDLARRRQLLIVEDCAQSVEGPVDDGDARADASLFSFGLIKTATAFGGALVRVRDPALASRMADRHRRWPVQPRLEYGAKVLRGAAALVASHPRVYRMLGRGGRDPSALVRTIPDGDADAFLTWVRRRPSPALVAVLRRRLSRFPAERLRRRAAAGDDLAAALPRALFRPGGGAPRTTHWLFPVVTDHPDRLIDGLRAEGFEATQGTSQIAAVAPEPPCARWVMAGIVFLPIQPEMPPAERQRLAEVVSALV